MRSVKGVAEESAVGQRDFDHTRAVDADHLSRAVVGISRGPGMQAVALLLISISHVVARPAIHG